MPNPNAKYVIAGLTFSRKSDVKAHISRILNEGPLPSIVAAEHEAFLRAMLNTRADKLRAIGNRKVARFERDWQPPPLKTTRAIWVVCEDGFRLDVSLYKAVSMLEPGVDPSGAEAADIAGQK